MKIAHLYLQLALCGLATLPLHASAQSCQYATEQQALNLFEQWNDSLKSADPHQVARLYQDNALLLPTVSKKPRLTEQERVEYFSHFLADKPSGRLDTHHFDAACNIATLTGLYTFDFAATGKQVAARYSFTYRWDGQRWLISHHHSSLLPSS